MNIPIVTQPTKKPIVFALHESKLNGFISAVDMDDHLRILAGMVSDFLVSFPIAAFILDWPPATAVLKGTRKDSLIYKLYEVLEANLSMSGYPITVLSSMAVLHHEPFETTLIEASSATRLASLH